MHQLGQQLLHFSFGHPRPWENSRGRCQDQEPFSPLLEAAGVRKSAPQMGKCVCPVPLVGCSGSNLGLYSDALALAVISALQ